MRLLLRLVFTVLASPLIFLPTIAMIGFATWEKHLHPVAGVGLALLAFLVLSAAGNWLARDRVTLDPYTARKRLRKPARDAAAPSPAGMASLPLTAASLALTAPAETHPAGPPEMMSRLPASLNRMVVEGLQAVATSENRPQAPPS